MSGKKGMHDKLIARPEAIERIRKRILSSRMAERLTNHALGQEEMTSSQVRAAEVLLRKVLPDLASSEIDDKRRDSWTDLLKQIANQRLKPAQPEIVSSDQAEAGPGLTH